MAGRPLKFPDKRTTLTIRLQASVRAMIERDAAENGRSLSEEIEWRLWEAERVADIEEHLAHMERIMMRMENFMAAGMICRYGRDT